MEGERLPFAARVPNSQAPAEWLDELLALCDGRIARVCIGARGSTPSHQVLLPGSFNPLHDGHREMASFAASLLNLPVAFELSLVNVAKSALDEREASRRVEQFSPTDVIWLTRAATFVEKAQLFPQAVFAVGVDTVTRIADPRFYADNPDRRDAAVNLLATYGCRFLVFGRLCDNDFVSLDDLRLPPALRAICLGTAESQFRCDISSTQLRKQSHPPSGPVI